MSGWDQQYDIEDWADELSRHDDERRARDDERIDSERQHPELADDD